MQYLPQCNACSSSLHLSCPSDVNGADIKRTSMDTRSSACCCGALQGILAANGDSPLEGDPDEWDKLFKV